jgi:hypothetical protein
LQNRSACNNVCPEIVRKRRLNFLSIEIMTLTDVVIPT